jgi:predicted nucleic acid-binding protein
VCDACSLLNVLATSRARDVLNDRRLLLTPKVRAEMLFVYADDTRTTRVQINDDLLRHEGVQTLQATLTEREIVASVAHATEMDDGEAESLAVAALRSMPLLSDDLAVARVAPRVGVVLETTLELVEAWSKERSVEDVRTALVSLRLRANYAPPRSHPLRAWFTKHSKRLG